MTSNTTPKGKHLVAFNMPRSMRRNIIRSTKGVGINAWRKLPLMAMTRRTGTSVINIGMRRIMPWENNHVR